ncbi:MAG: 2Fe-2S iron-sulfur cluster-binding protein, partial [Microthrixaceae bacterium]
MLIETTVNGVPRTLEVEPHELLLDMLRDRLGLTGAKRSCDVQVCGTCTVLIDGKPVSACTTLAHEARGRNVLTIEGLAELPSFARLEETFNRHLALQCGYCTPGMALTVTSLLEAGELSDDEEVVRHALSG